MFPSGEGGTASLEYDFMDQSRNWSGSSSAPAANNDDKDIRTNFFTAGVQYMFNRTWGVDVKVPYWQRHFETDDGGLKSYDHAALGDIRIRGIYTGFSADMSTGLEFGVKLPTGSHTLSGFDRDTAIGTGSTDALIGAYHRDRFDMDSPYTWSVQAKLDQPVLIQNGYRPGSEIDASAGVAHDPMDFVGDVTMAPMLQLINSYRWRDSGNSANPGNSGYERLLVSPGVEFMLGSNRLDADVALPVYQHVRGNQLVAPMLLQVVVSRDF